MNRILEIHNCFCCFIYLLFSKVGIFPQYKSETCLLYLYLENFRKRLQLLFFHFAFFLTIKIKKLIIIAVWKFRSAKKNKINPRFHQHLGPLVKIILNMILCLLFFLHRLFTSVFSYHLIFYKIWFNTYILVYLDWFQFLLL